MTGVWGVAVVCVLMAAFFGRWGAGLPRLACAV